MDVRGSFECPRLSPVSLTKKLASSGMFEVRFFVFLSSGEGEGRIMNFGLMMVEGYCIDNYVVKLRIELGVSLSNSAKMTTCLKPGIRATHLARSDKAPQPNLQ